MNTTTEHQKKFIHLFEKLAYIHDCLEILDAFLEWMMWGFCADKSLNWDCAKKYKEDERKLFPEMYKHYILHMNEVLNNKDWHDFFGQIYEEYAGRSRRDSKGQFFTPEHVCELMGAMIKSNTSTTGKGFADPCCGSGRMLLSFHVKEPGNYAVGCDLDRTCCLMTICNFLIHGVVGEVIWQDSLLNNFYGGWRVNQNLNNPFHEHFGTPHVISISHEESAIFKRIKTEPMLPIEPIMQELNIPNTQQLSLF